MMTGMCASDYHAGCEFQDDCSCICHVKADPMFADLMEYLMSEPGESNGTE